MKSKIILYSLAVSLITHGLILFGPFTKRPDNYKSVFSSKKSGFKVSFNQVKNRKRKTKSVKKTNREIKNKTQRSFKKQIITSDTAVTNSKVLQKTIPKYPYKSRKYHEEGVVLLRILVSNQGKAIKSEVLQSSGFERLDLSAVSAAMNSEYESASNNGISKESELELEFKFELNN